MKVNPVKQFVKSSISRFELNKEFRTRGYNKCYNLYDKNNNYRGDINLRHFIAAAIMVYKVRYLPKEL